MRKKKWEENRNPPPISGTKNTEKCRNYFPGLVFLAVGFLTADCLATGFFAADAAFAGGFEAALFVAVFFAAGFFSGAFLAGVFFAGAAFFWAIGIPPFKPQ